MGVCSDTHGCSFTSDKEAFLDRLQYELNDEKENGELPEFGDAVGDFAVSA
jgi:hypothetical protein